MIARVVFFAFGLATLFYGLFWLAGCTNFFKNKARLVRIAKRAVLLILTIVATALVLNALISVDNII